MEAPSIDVHDVHSRQCTDRMGPKIDKQIVATTKQKKSVFTLKRSPWMSKTRQRMVFRRIHVEDSLLPRRKIWSLDFVGRDYHSSLEAILLPIGCLLDTLIMACYKLHITNISKYVVQFLIITHMIQIKNVFFIAQMASFHSAFAIIHSFSSTCLLKLSSKPHPPMRELP